VLVNSNAAHDRDCNGMESVRFQTHSLLASALSFRMRRRRWPHRRNCQKHSHSVHQCRCAGAHGWSRFREHLTRRLVSGKPNPRACSGSIKSKTAQGKARRPKVEAVATGRLTRMTKTQKRAGSPRTAVSRFQSLSLSTDHRDQRRAVTFGYNCKARPPRTCTSAYTPPPLRGHAEVRLSRENQSRSQRSGEGPRNDQQLTHMARCSGSYKRVCGPQIAALT
jgi:hypothetical protein